MRRVERGFRLAVALVAGVTVGTLLDRGDVSAEQPWPETPAGAAGRFGGQPDRWEKNPDGGWHFKQGDTSAIINPQGNIMEGFIETPNGLVCFASAGKSIALKGGTVWPLSGEGAAQNLLGQMRNPSCELVTTEARGAELTEQARAGGSLEAIPEIVVSESNRFIETSVQEVWPETPADASARFGGSSSRWEKNPDGGWQLKVGDKSVVINPGNNIMEGYFGDKSFVSAGKAVAIQGGTIWPESGVEAARELQQKKSNSELVTTEARGAELTEQARAGGSLE